MQTVAAQWLMISSTSSALLLSAIAAAGSIPILLLAVPAGVLGDLLDRRRLILGAQTLMLLAAVALAVLAAPGKAGAFVDAAASLRRTRRRTGATHWHLHRDLTDTDLFQEMFVVGSWEEHERQHARLDRRDRAVLDEIDTLLRPGAARTAHHAIGVRPPRHHGRRADNSG